jgi:hypothetical protein
MYTNIQQAITAVESSASSIFTKEDVIKLLNSIDLESAAAPSADDFDVDELVESVESIFDHFDSADIVNYEDVSLSLNYDNRIEIDSVNVELDNLTSEVSAAIYEFFKKSNKKKTR